MNQPTSVASQRSSPELLTKDTERRSAQEIAELIESIGGSFSATCGNNTISFAIEVLPGDIKTGLELLSDALVQPRFDSMTFETEREAQIASLREDDDEILEYGFRRLRERFFGEHPFSVAPDGRIEDLERLTVDDVRAQFTQLVRADNIIISITGDFDPQTLDSELTSLLEERLCTDAFTASAPDCFIRNRRPHR
jgi:zinc protease